MAVCQSLIWIIMFCVVSLEVVSFGAGLLQVGCVEVPLGELLPADFEGRGP